MDELVTRLARLQVSVWHPDADAGVVHKEIHWYSTRHACLTFLAASGVPVPILAAWAGYADGGAVAMRTYVKPNAEQLRGASDALAQLLG